MSDLVERLRAEADGLDKAFRRNLAVTSTEAVTMREAAAHIERIEALNAAQAQAIGAALAELETEGKELWPRAGAAWEILSKAATPTTEGATS